MIDDLPSNLAADLWPPSAFLPSLLGSVPTPQVLYQMFRAGFLGMQDIPRTSDRAPSRSFYTWKVDTAAVFDHMSGDFDQGVWRILGSADLAAGGCVLCFVYLGHGCTDQRCWEVSVVLCLPASVLWPLLSGPTHVCLRHMGGSVTPLFSVHMMLCR